MCQVTDGKGNQRATQQDGTNSAQQKKKYGRDQTRHDKHNNTARDDRSIKQTEIKILQQHNG